MKDRKEILLKNISISQNGLEISPLYRPTLKKDTANIFYTDYCDADESRRKHANYEHDPIMDIDFVWVPGNALRQCIPDNLSFKYAIASHVFEHVPNPIGFLNDVLSVLDVGGVFSLALPNKKYCFDKFRNNTEASVLIDHWLRNQSIPSSYQLYDFMTRSVDFDSSEKFEDANRNYSNEEAISFVLNAHQTGTYFDAHCSVFTPDSFVSVFNEINQLGIINVEISDYEEGPDEFFVQFVKKGEPKLTVNMVGQGNRSISELETIVREKEIALRHAESAFYQAVEIQKQLKKYNLVYAFKKILRIP